MTGSYVPDRGDIVWIDFGTSPEHHDTFGHEQQEHRPAFCISPYRLNDRTGMVVVCAMTRQVKPVPWQEPMPPGFFDQPSAVLIGQIRTIDWRARNVRLFKRAPVETVAAVLAKVKVFVQ